MAHIVVNAVSLRPGGGLQVICGLLASFSTANSYTVIWTDPQSKEIFDRIVGEKKHIKFVRPLENTSNFMAFYWQMIHFKKFAQNINADLAFGVNHHFPMGNIKQVIYHLNVMRFERDKEAYFSPDEIKNKLRDWRSRRALRLADINAFESEYLLQIAEEKTATINAAQVCYIGLQDKYFKQKRHVTPCRQRKPHIIALTSPQPHKDNPTLIHMLSELCRERPEIDWRLKIAGGRSANAFADLKSLAKELEVADKIEWLGFCDHEALSEIGKDSLCLVSASRIESFSMVALEAMSWGCPPIVVDATSMPESVGEAGILVGAGDAKGFAQAVMKLHDDSALHQSYVEAGYKRASTLTWSTAARNFEEIFASLG